MARIIIPGGPGAGKTTLLLALQARATPSSAIVRALSSKTAVGAG
jgi:predicted ATPase